MMRSPPPSQHSKLRQSLRLKRNRVLRLLLAGMLPQRMLMRDLPATPLPAMIPVEKAPLLPLLLLLLLLLPPSRPRRRLLRLRRRLRQLRTRLLRAWRSWKPSWRR